MTQRARLAVVSLALASTSCACGTGEQADSGSLRDQIAVTGAFRERPSIRIDDDLKVTNSQSWVTEPGKGDVVAAGSTVILQLTLANGRTGKVAVSTLDKGQRPLDIKLGDEVFPSLVEAVVGRRAHTRVVVASTPGDAYGDSGAPQVGIRKDDPVVMVADILSTDPTSVLDGPTGATTAAPATAPQVLQKGGVPVAVDFARARKPKKLVVIPLREGTGPRVELPDRVAVRYLVQIWGRDAPVEETYRKQPSVFSIGTATGVIKAWDRALVGQKEGARLMVITPPALAYGSSPQADIPADSTLVFVVDVLGVG